MVSVASMVGAKRKADATGRVLLCGKQDWGDVPEVGFLEDVRWTNLTQVSWLVGSVEVVTQRSSGIRRTLHAVEANSRDGVQPVCVPCRQAVAHADGRRRPARGRSRTSPRAVSAYARQASGCRQPLTRGSRQNCSGWCQPPPPAVPARPRAGLVTAFRLQPGSLPSPSCSLP